MSIEKDTKNKLTNLLLQVKSIKEPITCEEALDLRNLASELSREIYNKFHTQQKGSVDIIDCF
ncbi:hypothetical protein ACV772_000128 [Proteus mirabilis]|uniref:hypothetical protein n=1 Tax=Proteus TaxID=583 RepID=UPI000538FE7E|nr:MULTISPECIES: hypothetical protein [Proteus]AUT90900.1 hypothetical protein MC46_003900 [Proteus mirabilis]EIT1737167.1 hypothetical protein [Proteus mirabilis]EJG2208868.1 hypothetical protein [Proteus mirabilis]EKU2369398.1 hypothetical protein [Proteus mirabilis]EKU7916187.1 hypothetical protein [Proteus mirabilis]